MGKGIKNSSSGHTHDSRVTPGLNMNKYKGNYLVLETIRSLLFVNTGRSQSSCI